MTLPYSTVAPQHAAVLSMLTRDLEAVLEYVHPVDAHLQVYSFRIHQLLLRAASEFESIAQAIARHLNLPLPERPTMRDLQPLASKLGLDGCTVGLTMWQPTTRFVDPLAGWLQGRNSPEWFVAYNLVKHNRAENFAGASLDTLTCALASCHLLLTRSGALQPSGTPNHIHHPDGGVEFLYLPLPFSVLQRAAAGDHAPPLK